MGISVAVAVSPTVFATPAATAPHGRVPPVIGAATSWSVELTPLQNKLLVFDEVLLLTAAASRPPFDSFSMSPTLIGANVPVALQTAPALPVI